ncbi:MAG: acetoacetate decarboxylase family protein [Nevskia sp.]|nr:acetoacetate decarboxylase family protein [Nevskia sp.]
MGAEGSHAAKAGYTHPFLAGVTQTEAHCSAGRCDMPILYNDSSLIFLFYRVPVEAAVDLITNARLEPLPVFGKAIVGLAAFEYRDTSAGVYNEIGLTVLTARVGSSPYWPGFLMNPQHEPDAGFFVASLPVTTELARAAGAEFWNYPKYVTGISTHFAPDGVQVELAGELSLRYTPARSLTVNAFPIVTFSVHDGQLLRTYIRTNGRMRLSRGKTAALTCTGKGPTAERVKALGLDHSTPFAVCTVEPFRSILPYGVPVV